MVSAPVVLALEPDTVRLLAASVTSMVEVLAAVSVKARSVEAEDPVYCSVPPSSTRLAAALEAWPTLPATPPLPMVATLSVPALTVVAPV